MPLQQFTTYDVIVDTVPGSFLLLLLIPILPRETINIIAGAAVTSGIVIIGLGFVAGRLIHTLGLGYNDSDVFRMEGGSIAPRVVRDLCKEMIPDGESVSEYLKDEDRYEEAISYGQAILYPRETLYGRYEMLSTFFRNMYYATSIIIAVYIIRVIIGMAANEYSLQAKGMTGAAPPVVYATIAIIMAVLSYIFKQGWNTFVKRKSKAFFHDLHRVLKS